MKKHLPALILLFALFLVSCKASKNYLERSDESKALRDAVKQLGKDNNDEKAMAAIPVLYQNITANRLKQIQDLRSSPDINRFDKTINLYQDLQDAYDAIIHSPSAFKLVTPVSYDTQLFEAKQAAAEAYYNAGKNELNNPDRASAKKAYGFFKKSESYIPGFRDAKSMAQQAYDQAVVYVVINPIQDNSWFSNQTWNNGLSYSNDYFQQSLVRDLSNLNNAYYPSAFYTDWQARSQNISPDWVVNMTVRNIIMPYMPTEYRYKKNLSAEIEIGKDTSGKPIHKTVHATLNIVRSTIIARADMDVSINDINNGDLISRRNFNEEYRWQTERATYTGDSRALGSGDWEMINRVYHIPVRDVLLEELYRKIYPEVRSFLTYAVQW